MAYLALRHKGFALRGYLYLPGGLLHHLFTLTTCWAYRFRPPVVQMAVCFCRTFRRPLRDAQSLTGLLLYAAPTFLP